MSDYAIQSSILIMYFIDNFLAAYIILLCNIPHDDEG